MLTVYSPISLAFVTICVITTGSMASLALVITAAAQFTQKPLKTNSRNRRIKCHR